MINAGIITGRLTAVPELKKTASGISYCSFTVAVQRRFADKEGKRETDYIDCVAYRQSAEFLCQNFKKGQMVGVEGEIRTRTYKDRDGNSRKSTELNAEHISFCGNKGTSAPETESLSGQGYVDIPVDEDDYGVLPWKEGDEQ